MIASRRALIAIGLFVAGSIAACPAEGLARESSRVRVAIAVDLRSKLMGAEANALTIKTLCLILKRNHIDCVIDVLDGNDISPTTILNYYRNLESREDDTLLFYYTGHGATDPAYGHYFATTGGDLLRSTVREAMLAKKPHLAILLTDCCSLSGRIKLVPAPAAPPPSEKFFKDLFLRHEGVVDITAASYRGPGDSEAAYFYPRSGGVFTEALERTIQSARTEDYDTNGDGFFSWAEFYPKLKARTAIQFQVYKRAVRNGTITIDDADGLARLMAQETQTPQAFSLGSQFPIVRPVEAAPGRLRFGALLRENYGFGVVVDQVVDGTPATRVKVAGEVGGVATERVASLVTGDTILFVNGVRVEGIASFLKLLAEVPPGGTLRFEGRDQGADLKDTYRASVKLDD